MKKAIAVALVVAVFTAVTGCAGAQIKKADIDAVKTAGILSLTVKKTGPANPENEAILKQAANYAVVALETKLKAVAPFKVVPAAALSKVPEYQNAGTVAKATGALKYIKENPAGMTQDGSSSTETTGDFMAALKAGLQAAADAAAMQQDPAGAAQKIIDKGKEDAVGASGLPFIPYGILNNETQGTVRYVNGVKQGGPNEGLKQMMLEEAKAVCAKTRLDAVMVVYGEAVAEPPKGVRVITGDRVVGTLKFDMTMMIINKNGEIIADFNWPVMDDLAPLKLARPTHKAVTWKTIGNKNWPDKIEVNLADEKGVLLKDLKELADISADHLANKLADAITAAK